MNYLCRKNKLQVIIYLLYIFVLCSCAISKDIGSVPVLDLSHNQINKDVVINLPGGSNSLLIGAPISIEIEVRGNDFVIFPNDYGIHVYYWDNEWMIANLIPIKTPDGDILLQPAKGNYLYFGSTMVEPVITRLTEPVKSPNYNCGMQIHKW